MALRVVVMICSHFFATVIGRSHAKEMEGIDGIGSRTIQKKMKMCHSSPTIIRRRTVLVVHRVLTLNDALPDQITQATSTTAAMGATKEELFLQKDSIFGANLGIKQNATQSSFGSSISRVFKREQIPVI